MAQNYAVAFSVIPRSLRGPFISVVTCKISNIFSQPSSTTSKTESARPFELQQHDKLSPPLSLYFTFCL